MLQLGHFIISEPHTCSKFSFHFCNYISYTGIQTFHGENSSHHFFCVCGLCNPSTEIQILYSHWMFDEWRDEWCSMLLEPCLWRMSWTGCVHLHIQHFHPPTFSTSNQRAVILENKNIMRSTAELKDLF